LEFKVKVLKALLAAFTVSLAGTAALAADAPDPLQASPADAARSAPADPDEVRITVCAAKFSPEMPWRVRAIDPVAKRLMAKPGCWRRVGVGRSRFLQMDTALIVLDRQPGVEGFTLVEDGVDTGGRLFRRIRQPGEPIQSPHRPSRPNRPAQPAQPAPQPAQPG
jgi:hypothetical protein